MNAGTLVQAPDLVRRKFYRALTLVPGWSWVFAHRGRRILTAYVGATFVLGFLSLIWPLGMLVVSPLLWGGLHLLASFRYSSEMTMTTPQHFRIVFWSAGLLALVIAGARLLLPGAARFELWASGIAALLIAAIFLKTQATDRKIQLRKIAVMTFAIAGLTAAFVITPILTLGVLAFGHHLVAFAVWRKFAAKRGQAAIVAVAFALFALCHVLLFTGTFDFVFQSWDAGHSFNDNIWGFENVARLSGLNVQNEWLYYLTVAFSFGQSLHYFIWLKMIPEHHLEQNVPLTFAQSFKRWRKDVGGVALIVTAIAVLLFPVTWVFAGLAAAQIYYFALAGFHGYFEIVAYASSSEPI